MKPFAPVTNTRFGSAGVCPCSPTGAGRPIASSVPLHAARLAELLPAGRLRVELAVDVDVQHGGLSGGERALERGRELLRAPDALAVAADAARELVVADAGEVDAAALPVRRAVALRDEGRLLHAPRRVDRDDDDDRELLAQRGLELHRVEAEG